MNSQQSPTTKFDGRIGPFITFIPAKILGNPLIWVVGGLSLFSNSWAVRRALWSTVSFDNNLQSLLRWFYEFQKEFHFGTACTWLAVLLILRVVVWYATSSYRIDGHFLYVNNGLFGRVGPMFFQSFINTVTIPLVIDCDVTRNPIQALFNAGTVIITTSDRAQVVMDFVHKPVRTRDLILAHSNLKNVRIIASAN